MSLAGIGCPILCLSSRTTITSPHIPEEDAYYVISTRQTCNAEFRVSQKDVMSTEVNLGQVKQLTCFTSLPSSFFGEFFYFVNFQL